MIIEIGSKPFNLLGKSWHLTRRICFAVLFSVLSSQFLCRNGLGETHTNPLERTINQTVCCCFLSGLAALFFELVELPHWQIEITFSHTSLCGVLIFCWQSAPVRPRPLPYVPPFLYQLVSIIFLCINFSLSTCLYHNLSHRHIHLYCINFSVSAAL